MRMKKKTKSKISGVLRAVWYSSVVLAILLAGVMFACRRSLPLPGWCYDVNTTVTPYCVTAGEKVKPLAPVLAKGKILACDMMAVINTGYRRTGHWIGKQWTKLMRKIDPNNEYGMVDYASAVGAVTRDIPKERRLKKAPQSPATARPAPSPR